MSRCRFTHRENNRGFVMPVVVLLALIGGLVVSVALTRSAQRYTIVREQIRDYRDTHREFGIKTITANWLEYSASQDIDGMTGGSGQGGKAFEIRLPEGGTIEASFFPAQDTALVEPLGLTGKEARIVRSLRDRLRETETPGRIDDLTRLIGPLGIDLQRADSSLITALAAAAFDDPTGESASLGDDLAVALLAERSSGDPDNASLTAVAERFNLEGEDRELLEQLFVVEPLLWRVRVVYREGMDPTGRSDRIETYEGVVELPDGSLAAGGGEHANQVFLSWERVETEPGYTQPGSR